jgi:hypothetical protein
LTPGDGQSGFDPTRFRRRRVLILVAALIAHLSLGFFKYTEPTGDAAEYHALAVSLVTHGTLALGDDETDICSWRGCTLALARVRTPILL